MPKKNKEEIAAEKEKEKLRALRRGPNLDRFLEGKNGLLFLTLRVHGFIQ